MPTIRLVPSTYSLSNTSLSVSNADNMYTNTDSSTYGTVSTTSTNTRYIYIKGFNFDDIPTGAIVNSFSIKIKANESTLSTSSQYRPYLCNGSTTITGTFSAITTTVTTQTCSNVTATWDTIKGYGDDFGVRVTVRRSGNSGTGYLYFYGAEIEVDYTLPDPRTITTTLTGNGTISPSGQSTSYDGQEFELTITPTDITDPVVVTNNGTDVSSELVEHYSGGTPTSASKTAESYTTELSASGANFYTGSSTTGNYFNYAVGHTAESPGSTSTSYNTYVKDNGSNTATGWAWYTFDFSSIPATAEVTSIEVRCYGACESTTNDSTHKANITLYSGSILKSTEQHFTSTSNGIITISNPGEWDREELQSAKLKFEVAYYGGRLFGITWVVNYMYGGTLHHYTYTYTVNGNAAIEVTIGSAPIGAKLYLKVNGSWVQVTKAYKKVNGSWVEQADISTLFNTTDHFKQGT